MSGTGPSRAVVFDLDGTLIDSLPLVLAAITHALEPFGARPPADIFARLGGPPERFLATLLGDVKNVPVALGRMAQYHGANAHLIRPYDGVRGLLAQLRAEGVKLGIWTGRDRVSCDWLLREHQLTELVDAVVCGDDLPSHKPDPEGLQELIRRLGVSPSDTLFVGDADVDVQGGAACGVDTVLIRHMRQVEEQISALSWRLVASPTEAYEVVSGWVKRSR